MNLTFLKRLILGITVFCLMVSCSNIFHRHITVVGTALNDKDGAIVETETGDYILHKFEEWDTITYGKKVTVSGYLVSKTYKKHSTPERQVQERVGRVYIIKRPKWRVLE